MFGQGIYGCKKQEVKKGVASPIDFLGKIEISKFVTCRCWNTTLMNDNYYTNIR